MTNNLIEALEKAEGPSRELDASWREYVDSVSSSPALARLHMSSAQFSKRSIFEAGYLAALRAKENDDA